MTRRRLLSGIALLFVVGFLVLLILHPTFSSDETENRLWESLVYRLIGSVVFAVLLIDRGFRLWNGMHISYLAVLLPCLAVAVNNLPILSLILGDAYLIRADLIWLFALDCLFIGIFEELAFRGTVQMILLENRRSSRQKIFWSVVFSSLLFGAFHLINLLEGAGFGGTMLQVGYSFLIGGMCSIVLLKTGNLIWCILLHAIYNFCGGLVPTLGGGALWDTPTVVFTVLLALAVGAWMIWTLLHVTEAEVAKLFWTKNKDITQAECDQ